MFENDDEVRDVMERLSALAPQANEFPVPAGRALGQLHKSLDSRRPQAPVGFMRSRQSTMSKRVLAVGATAVLAVALLLAVFPSARAAANDFLGLFRVEKFAPISITPQQLALLNQLESEGLNPGEMVMTKEPGDPQQVSTADEAAAYAGFPVRTLDTDIVAPETFVMSDAAGYLVVNLDGARKIVEAVGVDPALLPDSLDGARIDVSMPPSVQQVFADGLVFMQGRSPYVNYPADADPTVLGEALLRVLGMDPDAAHQMAASIDWTSTMLLPIPQEFATYSQVRVDGTDGIAITPVDGTSEAAVLWQKDGMVYVLSGPFSVDVLLEHAANLH